MSTNRDAVQERYRQAALRMADHGSDRCHSGCCGCCGMSIEEEMEACGTAYTVAELAEAGLDRSFSLGCGNPILLAQLRPGEVVLDLGSGAGLDVLLAARRVAPGGHAYGVDMTGEMLALADRNRERAGVTNATFLAGTLERLPLGDTSVDVVLSNCVINLVEDKRAALREAFRVLRPGGRLAVSDVVELRPLPEAVKLDPDARAGCVAGAIPVDDYRRLLREAGFESVEIEVIGGPEPSGAVGSASIRARKPAPARAGFGPAGRGRPGGGTAIG
ncbi:MAG TPA: arsenite methyltransferase [Candidatus Dormibacteraeota bacterium]|nr:arsenite methyltransferase [Candidatus Dormibacteraeota bacterium]